MSVVTVERMPIGRAVGLFVLYIVLHVIIALLLKNTQKQRNEDSHDKELEEQEKWLKIAVKWFPAMYLIFLILMFYFTGW